MWYERDESDDLLRFEEFIEKRRRGHWHWVGSASHIDSSTFTDKYVS